MNRGSGHTRRFSRMHVSVLNPDELKMALLSGKASSGSFEKRAPGPRNFRSIFGWNPIGLSRKIFRNPNVWERQAEKKENKRKNKNNFDERFKVHWKKGSLKLKEIHFCSLCINPRVLFSSNFSSAVLSSKKNVLSSIVDKSPWDTYAM